MAIRMTFPIITLYCTQHVNYKFINLILLWTQIRYPISHSHWYTMSIVCNLENIRFYNGMTFSWTISINVDFVARSRYLGQGKAITSHSKLQNVITYPCLRYLLLATKSSNTKACSYHGQMPSIQKFFYILIHAGHVEKQTGCSISTPKWAFHQSSYQHFIYIGICGHGRTTIYFYAAFYVMCSIS